MINTDEDFDWGRVIFSEEMIVSTDFNGPVRVVVVNVSDASTTEVIGVYSKDIVSDVV